MKKYQAHGLEEIPLAPANFSTPHPEGENQPIARKCSTASRPGARARPESVIVQTKLHGLTGNLLVWASLRRPGGMDGLRCGDPGLEASGRPG